MKRTINNIEDFREDVPVYKLLLEAIEAMEKQEALKLAIILNELNTTHNLKIEVEQPIRGRETEITGGNACLKQ